MKTEYIVNEYFRWETEDLRDAINHGMEFTVIEMGVREYIRRRLIGEIMRDSINLLSPYTMKEGTVNYCYLRYEDIPYGMRSSANGYIVPT